MFRALTLLPVQWLATLNGAQVGALEDVTLRAESLGYGEPLSLLPGAPFLRPSSAPRTLGIDGPLQNLAFPCWTGWLAWRPDSQLALL